MLRTGWVKKLGLPVGDVPRHSPTFPSANNTDLWYLVGLLQGDGCVYTSKGHATIEVACIDKGLIRHAYSLFKQLFSIEPSIIQLRTPKGDKPYTRVRIHSIDIYRWLKSLGLEFGCEVWNVPILPKNLFFAYVAGLFDSDGSVIIDKRKKVITKVYISSKNLRSLRLIRKVLSRCSIASRIYHENSASRFSRFPQYRLVILGRENYSKFIENVGIHCRSKKSSRLHLGYLPDETGCGSVKACKAINLMFSPQ